MKLLLTSGGISNAVNTMAAAERRAARVGGLAYAMDDQSAIKVVDGKVERVSEGRWKEFKSGRQCGIEN